MKTAYIFQPQIKIICMEIEGNTIQNSVIMPITLQCTNLNFTHLFRNSKMTVTQIEIFLKFHNIRLLHTALLCLKTFFFFPKKMHTENTEQRKSSLHAGRIRCSLQSLSWIIIGIARIIGAVLRLRSISIFWSMETINILKSHFCTFNS